MFSAKKQTISNEEQRVGALRIQSSAYGLCIPLVWGTTRVSGNLMWYGDFTATAHTTTEEVGGKGGGGGTVTTNTTYTYSTALIMGLGGKEQNHAVRAGLFGVPRQLQPVALDLPHQQAP